MTPPDHQPEPPAGPASTPTGSPTADEPIVDFSRAARRIRASALTAGTVALAGWLVTGLVTDGVDPGELGGWIGLALAGMFLVEVWVVGGSAARGMLRAGDRGERLAGGDVGILPPQLTRSGRAVRRARDERPGPTPPDPGPR